MLHRHNKIYWQPLLLLALITVVSISIALTAITTAHNSVPLNKSGTVAKKAAAIKPISGQKITTNLPVQLKIPVIKVDAAIDYTGLTPDGAMEVKKDQDKVFWYSYGPRPGEEGSAVIAGHYGWFDGKPSVFNNLHTLNKGDSISIVDEKGVTNNFIVRESRRYDPKADASDVFKSNDGKSHLNLITCDGVWNNDKESYSNRLVIFTDKKV